MAHGQRLTGALKHLLPYDLSFKNVFRRLEDAEGHGSHAVQLPSGYTMSFHAEPTEGSGCLDDGSPDFACSRERGHRGPHAAIEWGDKNGSGRVLDIWEGRR